MNLTLFMLITLLTSTIFDVIFNPYLLMLKWEKNFYAKVINF